jgi:hypothetical protein
MDHPPQIKSQGSGRKSGPVRWLAGALIVLFVITPVGLYAWRYLYNPCEVDSVKEASTYLLTQLKSYDGVYQVAATASRTSLDRPVLVMQQIHLDTKEIAVPVCMQTAKEELINYMGTVIRAFRDWEAGEADATIRGLIRQSDTYYDNFHKELEAVNKCAPFCIP